MLVQCPSAPTAAPAEWLDGVRGLHPVLWQKTHPPLAGDLPEGSLKAVHARTMF